MERRPSSFDRSDVVGRVHAALVAATTRVTFLCESGGTVIWASPSLGPLLGLSPETFVGSVIDRSPCSEGDRLILGGDGRPYCIEVSTTDLCNDPSVQGLLVEWTVRPWSGLLGRDPITGLLTLARLAERVGHAGRLGEHDVAVIRLRADRALPDDALRHIGQRVTRALRPGELAGRLEDGDFVVVRPGRSTLAGATHIAQRLRSTVNGPVRLATGISSIRLAAGVATGEAGSLDTLLDRARQDLIGTDR